MSMKEVFYDPATKSVVFVPRSNTDIVKPVSLPSTAFSFGSSNRGLIPVGAIVPWVPGYFTSSSNTGYTNVTPVADTVAAANAFLNPMGYWVCDGSAVNDPESPIWNGLNRYLPNVSDQRFLMGSAFAGGTSQAGSTFLIDHTHTVSNLSVSVNHAHTNTSVYGGSVGGDGAHCHTSYSFRNASGSSGSPGAITTCSCLTKDWAATLESPDPWNTGHGHTFSLCAYGMAFTGSATGTGSVGSGSVATSTDNSPQYLKVFYVVRVK